MTVRGVIFDLYGTLVQIRERRDPYARLFLAAGITDPEAIRKARRICLTEGFADLAALAKRLAPERMLSLPEIEEALAVEVATVALFPETLAVLRRLRETGIALTVVSNLASPYKSPYFSLGLGDWIPRPVFSCDEGTVKPEPMIYEIALARLGTRPGETLMVGDDPAKDVEGPAKLGIKSVLLDRSGTRPAIRSLLELPL